MEICLSRSCGIMCNGGEELDKGNELCRVFARVGDMEEGVQVRFLWKVVDYVEVH